MDETRKEHVVYLVKEKEDEGNDVYKFGMTTQNGFERYNQGSYAKGVKILVHLSCKNSLECERNIREQFKHNFVRVRGYEYYKGDVDMMKNIICNVVLNENPSCKRRRTEENAEDNQHKKIKLMQCENNNEYVDTNDNECVSDNIINIVKNIIYHLNNKSIQMNTSFQFNNNLTFQSGSKQSRSKQSGCKHKLKHKQN